MLLRKLSVISYKNIREATLRLSPKINCLIGANGAGKTNVLDAVFYLSFCRSATKALDSQVIRHGDEFFVLEGEYLSDSGDVDTVYCGMKRGTKKHVKLNGKEYRRLSAHIGLVPLVLVSPSDTMLIDGGSEHRRRLMDLVISQYDHVYLDALGRYNKALQQRNALLKQETEPDGELMDAYERQMAAGGELIYSKRDDFIRRLEPVFQTVYGEISGGRETVGLAYRSHCERGPLIDTIRGGRERDRILGFSTHGIHRDDLEMTLDGYPLMSEGSQGQNKTFVVSLKLAQFDTLASRPLGAQCRPVLLLDDIFDKLDAERVERIVSLVAGERFGQIFITDTNRTHLDSILSASALDYKLFTVDDGEITPA